MGKRWDLPFRQEMKYTYKEISSSTEEVN